MKRGELLYEGKAKRIYGTEDPDVVWVVYKDDATAFNGLKKGAITGKGEWNNRISSLFFEYLGRHGIVHHFVKTLSATEQLVRKVTILPLEVVVRNWAAGSLVKRLGLKEGTKLQYPVVELYYKNDDLGDPLINDDHIRLLQLADENQLAQIRSEALRINELLIQRMEACDILLIDFKLEFGVDASGTLLLADEISPDTCRFWDRATKKPLDKDRFRRDLGEVEAAYREIWTRLGGDAHV